MYDRNTLDEKLVIFNNNFKKRGPSDLRFQDGRKGLTDGHYRNGRLICHSEAAEESHAFNECLTQRINEFISLYFRRFTTVAIFYKKV